MTREAWNRRLRAARLGLVVIAVAVTAGCGSGTTGRTGAKPSQTALTMVALNESVGRAVFHLDCRPAGGDVPHPSRTCAAIARQPGLIEHPSPFTCAGGLFSWWDVTVTGRLDGRPIQRTFSTCWTPQMATIKALDLGWSVLQQHLVPRRHEGLMPGSTVRFPAGTLRAADVVTCDILGHRLATGVPTEQGPQATTSTGFGGANVTSVVLSVTHNSDGSVTASCHEGRA